jgi:hypothetical protein
MRAFYNFVIIFVGIVFFLFGCENVPPNNTHYINGFKYNDPSYQKEIIVELKKKNIPILISDNGYVSYPADYITIVETVLKRLDNNPYTEFYEKRYADRFVKILEGNNLEYKIKYLESNKIQVYWNTEDDILVRELKKKHLKSIFD